MRSFSPIPQETEAVGRQVVDSALHVHKRLGPGLLEHVYERCLVHVLRKRGLTVEQQVHYPIVFDGEVIDSGLRLDVVVHGLALVELKAVEQVLPVHEAQVLTYLKLSGLRLGYLINFNVPLLRDGLQRFVH